ncbi:hypothetical protein CFII64_25695 [Pseudomonas sp. CFII64]|nr:hypothetical protein CFII64_25695 [Pseudomonas sp. CFII64]
MARRAYRQDVGMVLKKTRLGGFFVVRGKVSSREDFVGPSNNVLTTRTQQTNIPMSM